MTKSSTNEKPSQAELLIGLTNNLKYHGVNVTQDGTHIILNDLSDDRLTTEIGWLYGYHREPNGVWATCEAKKIGTTRLEREARLKAALIVTKYSCDQMNLPVQWAATRDMAFRITALPDEEMLRLTHIPDDDELL